MADQSKAATEQVESKGKGKAAEKETGGMEVDDSSSEEEVDDVRFCMKTISLLKFEQMLKYYTAERANW